jgi:hypothetical protein
MSRPIMAALMLAMLTPQPSPAQHLVVETDQAEYILTDTIRISIHNPTSAVVEICQSPDFYIEYVETGECVWDCWGVAIISEVGPGVVYETDVSALDLFFTTHSLGTYRILVHECGTGHGSQPPAPQTEFDLVPPTPAEIHSWGCVKALYR